MSDLDLPPDSNSELAALAIARLESSGVKCWVVCAGARNLPLVKALLAWREERHYQIYHHFDERAAAFFALGLCKCQDSPVAVVTTSGTAVSELFSAVIEASYTSASLALVTADRPREFRGSGAPQSIEQAGIFGTYPVVAADIAEPAELAALPWMGEGVLHLNLCFAEPTAAPSLPWEAVADLPVWFPEPDPDESGRKVSVDWFFREVSRPLVLLGDLPEAWREPVKHLLDRHAAPFWAEATSGLREVAEWANRQLVSEGELKAYQPDGVLRIGGVPSCRFWRDLERNDDVFVHSLVYAPFSGLARESGWELCEDLTGLSPGPNPVESETKEGLVDDLTLLNPETERSTGDSLEAIPDWSGLLERHVRSEPGVMRRLSRVIPSEARVFLGNSLPIREWNLAADLTTPHADVWANRGVNGIDGEVATFLGLCQGVSEGWGIFGDLTALYDLNAPALIGQIDTERLRIVVLNNGGGRIFSRLPSLADLDEPAREVVENEHAISFRPWAELWGLEYLAWDVGASFPAELPDRCVIEIGIDERASALFWEAMGR
ncbi:MAG: 2-succinyl-5-enolpyruvyl-6-hydroxy-3-cyclohexene-1-carboxylic-acid synthase [Verrucomicrobiota bacterium]